MKIIDNIRNALRKDPPTLSICMMGPRAVGKTTVMASVLAESSDRFTGTQIFMRSANSNASRLISYREELGYAIERRDVAQLPATGEEADFRFELGLFGKKPTVVVSIKDFPGEYLVKEAEKVSTYMSEANIVFVAIDTPYLMEEGGAYNDEKNMPTLVKDFLIKNSAQLSNKLVLFVPLKCERWFHEGNIDKVTNQVVNMYGDLKNFFLENNIASFVTPILTLGGMEYDRMMDNTTRLGNVTKIATYRIYENNPTYSPLFCAQPMYYLLTYVAHYYQWQKKLPKGFMDVIRNSIFSYLTNDQDFLEEIEKMYKYILTNDQGYKMITSNSILNL